MKTAAAILTVAVAVVLCSCIRANDSTYHRLGPIEDPATFPFRFHIDREMPILASDGSPTTGRLIRSASCGEDKLLQYAVINNWKSADTSSAIVFYADLAFTDALEQVTVKTTEISSDHWGDFNGDGLCEVAITYAHNDSLWLDVVSYRSGLSSHLLLLEGVDRDGNGYWDGRASILASEDLNGDGCDELLLATDVGYDLYPRELICVDVANQDILWRFAHSGIVADRNFHIVRSDTSAPLLVVGIGSKGNAAVAGDMDDQHSYLLVLSTDGNLLWKRELGPAFSRATPVVFDYQSDGTLEIVVPWRSYSNDMHKDRTVLGVFSTTGDLLDSLVLDSLIGVRSLSTFDVDDNGSMELVASLTNKQTVVINSSLQVEKVCTGNSFLEIWAVADFCGLGRSQLLAVSESNMVWLLDTDMEPLAQLCVADKPFRGSSALNSAGVIVGPRGFVLAADNSKVHYFITISKAHWSAVFQRNHWLIVLCAAAPLCLIIALLVYAWYCTKKHARVVQEQRDHLSKALEDLRATEHKLGVVETSHKALEKIADAERLQKALLNAVTESLILFDHNMNIVALNDTAAKRLGMTVDDLVGKNASELTKSVWTEEEFSERQRIFKEVLTSGKPTVTQGVRGEYIFDSHYSPISNGQGQVTGIAVFACDVTQRQRFVEALRDSEDSLNRAQSAAKIGSWDWHLLENRLIWSDETYRQFGFEPGQITPSFETLERFIHPSDRQAVSQAIKETLEQNRSYSIDVRMIRMDGTSWTMHARGTVYRLDDGTPFRFVGTMQDITEHKRILEKLELSEKTSRALLNATTDAAVLIDREGRVVTANKAMAERFNMSTDDLTGEIIFDLMPEDLARDRRSNLTSMIQSPAPLITVNERDGITLRNSILPILDNNGILVQIAVFSQDITAERQAQAELKVGERRMRALFESMNDLVFVIDIEHRFTEFYQPQHEDLYVPSDDFIGKRYDEVLPPDVSQKLSESIELMDRIGGAQYFDYSMELGGKVEWFTATLTVVSSVDGESHSYLVVARNVSVRKQLEEALVQSEKTARALLNATTDAAVLIDREGRVVTTNQAMAERFNMSTDDLTGEIIFDFMPEDLARVRQSNMRKMIQSPAPTIVVDERDGRILRNSSVPILDDNGHLVQVAVFSQDITEEQRTMAELKLSEERYRTLVDSSPYGIMVIDAATREYTFVNPEFCKQLGYSFEEMVQKRVGDLSLEDSKYKTQSMYPAFQGNERNLLAGIPLVHKDGTIKHFDVKTVPTVYEGKESLIVMLRDVSEEMESQRKVHEQAGLLERLATRLIDIQEDDRKHIARELHDGIAQELSVAKIKLETAIMDAMPSQKKRLQDASQTLTKALGELRGITTELRPPILDRLGFVATVEWYVSTHCGDIEPILKVDGNPDGLTESRQLNLFRILQEIVNNARKHSGATRIEIELRFLGSETELLIRDNGRGFDFKQVRRNWQRDTSFGLLNITERVELLGGQIDITTGVDMGTTFQISIANK